MQATCTRIRQIGEKWYVDWDDGSGVEYPNFQTMLDEIAAAQTVEMIRTIFLGWWLSRSPDGSNQNLIVNKTMTFDLSNQNPIRVQ